jgi:hypothetical protein
MGNGRRNGNRLNFQITANYNMQPDDYSRWKRAFNKASEILFNATEGQLMFGNVFVTNNNEGVNNAEYVLLEPVPGSRGSTTSGAFGQIGRKINLAPYAQRSVLTILHELGHSLWTLQEEYARTLRPTIDFAVALPVGHGNLIVPIIESDLGVPDADLVGKNVILFFSDGSNQTRTIASKTINRITVTVAFTVNPQTASGVSIQITTGIECTGDINMGACIMEFSRDYAGTLEPDGTWIPAAKPITEFCTAFNHDPDSDTDQENNRHQACWDTIVARPNFTDFTLPAAGSAASKVTPAGYLPPQWIALESQPRFALVLDCSGSMNENGGSRLRGVKTGAAYWLDTAAVETDDLSIVWYNTGTDLPLPLTGFGTLTGGDVDNLKINIEAKSANGGTNIRDGLMVALNELTSPASASSSQISLLLTDGAHNSPAGTSMLEAVDDYQNSNSNIYTLGIGSGGEMDLDGLSTLASSTGGSSFTVGNGGEEFQIQNAMMEINNLIRGGLVSAIGDFVPDKMEYDNLSKEKINSELPFGRRPSLKELRKIYPEKNIREFLKNKRKVLSRFKTFHFEVEKGADSATFTLSYSKKGAAWMYLIDPNGIEVSLTYANLASLVSTNKQPYEFIKIKKPISGIWKVVAFIPSSKTAIQLKAFMGIQNTKISAYAETKSICKEGVIEITAGTNYRESLTGLHVNVYLKNENGSFVSRKLYDEKGEGIYSNIFALASGHYQGYVELRSPGNTYLANIDKIILEEGGIKNIGNPIVKHPPFVRTIPISFFIGKQKSGKLNRLELKELEIKKLDIKNLDIKKTNLKRK